jgi:hypothetical protein
MCRNAHEAVMFPVQRTCCFCRDPARSCSAVLARFARHDTRCAQQVVDLQSRTRSLYARLASMVMIAAVQGSPFNELRSDPFRISQSSLRGFRLQKVSSGADISGGVLLVVYRQSLTPAVRSNCQPMGRESVAGDPANAACEAVQWPWSQGLIICEMIR